MKPGLLTNFATALFILGALGTVALTSWYLLSMRQLHKSHPAVVAVNHNTVVVRSLIADSLEYRKRNPAIEPVLQAPPLLTPALNTNAPASR